MPDIPYGYCHCGCGGKTKIIKYPSDGVVGSHRRFLLHHNPSGSMSPHWKGGVVMTNGYAHVHQGKYKYKREHRIIAEEILGAPLPDGAVVHHVDGNKLNNSPSNLLICKSKSEHRLIHARQGALEACGHEDWIVCRYCHKHDDPQNLYINGTSRYHRKCKNEAQNLRNAQLRGEQ